MVRMEANFQACDALTPNFAARLSQKASCYRSDLTLEYGKRQLRLDSLINILSVDLHRGSMVTVVANGEDEQQAAGDIRALIAGEIA